MNATKTVGAYEAKTHLPALLKFVAKGREVIITRHGKPVAKLVPEEQPIDRQEVFRRIDEMRGCLKLGKGETLKDLIVAGRRI
jgi:prevent-host-death family protein